MKVLFLDIDGVLNSCKYEPTRNSEDEFIFIDETRMPYIQNIIKETNAKIVLTTTWRDCWKNDFEKCDKDGKYLSKLFSKYGLKVYDTTPITPEYYNRPREISMWIGNIEDNIESYAILDDDDFDWGYHRNRVVQTNPQKGYGLEEKHMLKVINILNDNEL